MAKTDRKYIRLQGIQIAFSVLRDVACEEWRSKIRNDDEERVVWEEFVAPFDACETLIDYYLKAEEGLINPADLAKSRKGLLSGDTYSNKTERYQKMLGALDRQLQEM